jgi:hypothetical protein
MITDTNRINFLLASGAFGTREQIDSMMVREATGELVTPVQPAHNEDARPPIRYCTRCQAPIDPKRVMRGSSFCGTECRREDMKERRAFRASKACRLCGRKARHKPAAKAPETVCDGSTAEKRLD